MILITEETRAGWCVVGARGRADAEAADELETALRSAVEKSKQVAADFSGLNYISSAGLRAVIQTMTFADAHSRIRLGLAEIVRPWREASH